MSPFVFQHISDVGASHPLVARIQIGLSELIDHSLLRQEKKNLLKTLCFDMAQNLLEAEKSCSSFLKEIHDILKSKSSDILLREIPGAKKIQEVKIFLKFIKNTLQLLAKCMEIFLDQKFTGPHFDKILKKANLVYGIDDEVCKTLQEHYEWVEKSITMRNEDEHSMSGKEFVCNFTLSSSKSGQPILVPPKFYNGEDVYDFTLFVFKNIVIFIEELLAFSLRNHFSPLIDFYDIPEEEIDFKCPKRFRLDLR